MQIRLLSEFKKAHEERAKQQYLADANKLLQLLKPYLVQIAEFSLETDFDRLNTMISHCKDSASTSISKKIHNFNQYTHLYEAYKTAYHASVQANKIILENHYQALLIHSDLQHAIKLVESFLKSEIDFDKFTEFYKKIQNNVKFIYEPAPLLKRISSLHKDIKRFRPKEIYIAFSMDLVHKKIDEFIKELRELKKIFKELEFVLNSFLYNFHADHAIEKLQLLDLSNIKQYNADELLKSIRSLVASIKETCVEAVLECGHQPSLRKTKSLDNLHIKKTLLNISQKKIYTKCTQILCDLLLLGRVEITNPEVNLFFSSVTTENSLLDIAEPLLQIISWLLRQQKIFPSGNFSSLYEEAEIIAWGYDNLNKLSINKHSAFSVLPSGKIQFRLHCKELYHMSDRQWLALHLILKMAHVAILELESADLYKLSTNKWHMLGNTLKDSFITKLNLTNNHLFHTNWQAFCSALELSHLDTLNLRNNELCRILPEQWKTFGHALKKSQTKYLSCSYNSFSQFSSIQWIAFGEAIKESGIEELDLSQNDLDQLHDEEWAKFCEAIKVSRIKKLKLSLNNFYLISPLQWYELGVAIKEAGVEFLDLSSDNSRQQQLSPSQWQALGEGLSGGNIKSLDISYNELRLMSVQWQIAGETIGKLGVIDLNLRHNLIDQLRYDDSKWKIFCEAIKLMKLASLDLSDNSQLGMLSPEQWKLLGYALKIAGASKLNLSENAFHCTTPEQWEAFGEALKIAGIEELSLACNRIGDKYICGSGRITTVNREGLTIETWNALCAALRKSGVKILHLEENFFDEEQQNELHAILIRNNKNKLFSLAHGSLKYAMLSTIWTNPNNGIGKVIIDNKAKLPTDLYEEGMRLRDKYGARFG